MTRSARKVIPVIVMSCVAFGGSQAFSQALTLEALYSPDTGNITMQAFDTSRTPASLQIATFQFLSPAQLLNGAAASMPASAVSFATVLNTEASSYFNPARTAAEIYATNFAGSTPLFDSTWNLGNVAGAGLSQSQIAAGFTTDPDVSPGGQALAGKFLYQVQGDPAFRVGTINAVPEPTSLAITSLAGLVGLSGLRRTFRRRR